MKILGDIVLTLVPDLDGRFNNKNTNGIAEGYKNFEEINRTVIYYKLKTNCHS